MGKKPSEVGIYFGTSENGMSKVANDVINHNKNPFDMWYDLNDEAGLYLDSNTKILLAMLCNSKWKRI